MLNSIFSVWVLSSLHELPGRFYSDKVIPCTALNRWKPETLLRAHFPVRLAPDSYPPTYCIWLARLLSAHMQVEAVGRSFLLP